MNNATQGIPQKGLRITGGSRKLLAAMALIAILGTSGSAMADPRPPYGHDRYDYDDHRDYYRPHWKHRHIRRAPPVVVVSPPVQRYYYYEPAPVIVTPPPPPPSGLSLIVPLYFR